MQGFFDALRCDVWRAIQWLQMQNTKEKQQWSCCPRKGQTHMRSHIQRDIVDKKQQSCNHANTQRTYHLAIPDSVLTSASLWFKLVYVYECKHLQCMHGWMCLDTYWVWLRASLCVCYLFWLHKETATIFFRYMLCLKGLSKFHC